MSMIPAANGAYVSIKTFNCLIENQNSSMVSEIYNDDLKTRKKQAGIDEESKDQN